MWNIVRTLLFALAVAGFVGQSSAHATPFQVFESSGGMAKMDCAEMMVMADQPSGGPMSPCDEMTPDCIAKMGCAAVGALLRPAQTVQCPSAPQGIRFGAVDVEREGAGPPPLKNPPKRLA
ncbi:hypothetical protein BrevBR_01105 [Brevundimonas sp. BR2-1]|uniref:hypothetical protein n=1 Tax=unclassified Brevundimonas TaxID=2622653 RepID=UPI0025C21538|nr:hypothetical protein [Brevundimonas sp. UBA7664]